MLKKLNGKITKLLFYIKNNFISFLFKLSVFTTMLILVYLVCILRQADSVRSSEYSNVHPIESSQKLMLTTEFQTHSDSPPSTTEVLTTIDNFISKTDDYAGTHPLFPVQEQTTTPMVTDETTETSLEQETTTETTVISDSQSTIPFKRSLSIGELNIWESTTQGLLLETTTKSDLIDEEAKDEKVSEEISEEEIEEQSSTTILTPTTTDSPHEVETLSYNTTPSTESDDLFMDNWSHFLPTKEDDDQINPPEETSSQLKVLKESTESFFLNEDDDFSPIEAPIILRNESAGAAGSSEEKNIQQAIEEFKNQSREVSKDSVEDKIIHVETRPILSSNNLFNLFTLDHLPATSNIKATWWPKPKNLPVPAPNTIKSKPVKSHKRHANAILPIQESEEVNAGPNIFNRLNQFQGLDSLLNKKLKNSVNLLERLFGNLLE